MNKQQQERLKTLRQKYESETLKHLRGRHDQRDHAWNRGMGRGGSAGLNTRRRRVMNRPRPGASGAAQVDTPWGPMPTRPMELPQTRLPRRRDAVAAGGLASMTRQAVLASRDFDFASSVFAKGFVEDAARFSPENKTNARMLRKFPFMERMVKRAADPAAAEKQYTETVEKMTDIMNGKSPGLWDIAKQAFLAEVIKGEQRNIETAQKLGFLAGGKGAIARRQQRLTGYKNEFHRVTRRIDGSVRDSLKPKTPGNLGRPVAVQGFTPIDEARVYDALAKVGSQIDASVLKTSHGGPLRYRVIAADLGPTSTLAYHDYSDSFIDPVSGRPMPMSTIVINSAKLDDQSIESAIAHEMGHALVAQLDSRFVEAHTEYLRNRLEGEELKYNAETTELYYEDLYPRYYPGVVMSGGDPRFAGTKFEDTPNWGRDETGAPEYIYPTETIATGIEEYITDPHGMMLRDADLFVHINSLLNGTADVYSSTKKPAAPVSTTPATPAKPGDSGTTPGDSSTTPATPAKPGDSGTTPGDSGTTPTTPAKPGDSGTTPTTPKRPGDSTTPSDSTKRVVPGRDGKPASAVDETGEFLDDEFEDVRTTAHAVSPVTVGTGAYGTGKHVTNEVVVKRTVDSGMDAGVEVSETVRRAGRRKAPYIDEMPTSSLPKSLQSNPEAVARLAYLQRYYDLALGRSRARSFESISGIEYKLDAARAAAEMFRIFPDARLLDDIVKILPSHPNALKRLSRAYGPSVLKEIQDIRDYANFWMQPTKSEIVRKGTPSETVIRTDAPIPDNIRKFGIPGQSLRPPVNIFPDNSAINPIPGKPYRHVANDNSVYNIMRRGEKLGDESFVNDDVYSLVENIEKNAENKQWHKIPKTSLPKPTTSKPAPKPEMPLISDDEAARTYLSDKKTANGIRKTNVELGMKTTADFALETDADGNEFPTRRNSPYLDEVNPETLPLDIREIAGDVGKLQRAYDAAAIKAITQRGTPEGDAAAIDAAEIAAMTFQQFPDITLLENAYALTGRIRDESKLPAKERTRLKQVRDFAGFWLEPRKDFAAREIPKALEKFGVPKFNIYQDMPLDRDESGRISKDGKSAIELISSEEFRDKITEPINPKLYGDILGETPDTSAAPAKRPEDKPKRPEDKPKRPADESKTPETLLPTTTDEGSETSTIVDRPLSPSDFESKPRADGETRSIASNIVGNSTVAYEPSTGAVYPMRHRVVDIRELIPSTKLNGDANPAYDSELQPRDRSRATSVMQINKIANTLVPSLMINDTNRLDDGSPIIDNEGQVLSGNGRTLAMQQLATSEKGREKLRQYKEELLANAEKYGLSREDIESMGIPVLVREVPNDIDKVKLANEANKPRTAVMSPKEQARADANVLPDSFLEAFTSGDDDTNLDAILNSPSNDGLRKQFINAMKDTERAGLLNRDASKLNNSGLARLKASMYAKIFDGPDSDIIIDAVTENPDDNFKRINAGIAGSLAGLGKVKAAVNDGSRPPEYKNLIDDIGIALSTYAQIRDSDFLSAMPIADAINYLKGGDMFSDVESLRSPLNDNAAQILQFFSENTNQQKTIREFINDMTFNMMNQDDYRQAEIDGIERPSYTSLLKQAIIDANQRKADAAAAREAKRRTSTTTADMFEGKSYKSEQELDQHIAMLMTTIKSFSDYARAADRNTPQFKILNNFALQNLDTLSALIQKKKVASKNKMTTTSTSNYEVHNKVMNKPKFRTGER